MEDIGVGEDNLRRLAGSLYEVVVVGIDTGNHVTPHPIVKQLHDSSLLAPLQMVVARGKHDLKIACGVLEAREDGTPHEHIVVALDISDYAMTCLPRREAVCCLYIARCDILIQTFHATHWSVMSLTSVTLSIHPFMTRAGLWVVRMI